MSDVADYDTDILLWSERQAALLRDLKTRASGLPNELDLENVAEEIESVGRSEQRAFESYVKQVFVHLLKMAAVSDPDLRLKWAEEIDNFKSQAESAVTPSMLQRSDVHSVWRHAVANARTILRRRGEALPGEPSKQSPFSFGDILDGEEIDAEALASRITFNA
ncbi:DUF29 domain-containing protein [Hansschlegelia sp.]|uniref:DUF29 domain-containing protein n=1 Tax=Hansschlegelia sp. TaxID=2041892 RepID=UPI002CE222CF|nr:DUF29 domain-containing protein [Hansschlegelia sp.]HVI30414.1 DUF29 domain-containing protein [Hansschlegelia sp.]